MRYFWNYSENDKRHYLISFFFYCRRCFTALQALAIYKGFAVAFFEKLRYNNNILRKGG